MSDAESMEAIWVRPCLCKVLYELFSECSVATSELPDHTCQNHRVLSHLRGGIAIPFYRWLGNRLGFQRPLVPVPKRSLVRFRFEGRGEALSARRSSAVQERSGAEGFSLLQAPYRDTVLSRGRGESHCNCPRRLHASRVHREPRRDRRDFPKSRIRIARHLLTLRSEQR